MKTKTWVAALAVCGLVIVAPPAVGQEDVDIIDIIECVLEGRYVVLDGRHTACRTRASGPSPCRCRTSVLEHLPDRALGADAVALVEATK